MSVTWILEREIFSDNHERLETSAIKAGHRVISWDDDWLENNKWPELNDEYVLFHGSLGNAHKIANDFPWAPGAFCNTRAFLCNYWYNEVKKWLVHKKWVESTVIDFINKPEFYLEQIDAFDSFFVRPNSPLKPFSGRVLQTESLTMKALDHGFYYDDENLPIIITPVVEIGKEWRVVIANGKPVCASSYESVGRVESEHDCPDEVWKIASDISSSITQPDPIYILDVCETGDEFKLLELNPFSGADLYNCNRDSIVAAVSEPA
ncbi:MAG: ATP-grasp domain-containing protein [bacterium]|nr:ATP-grasp domain-containing protein [bacterium]